MITLKSEKEINTMRIGGKILANIFHDIKFFCLSGVSTLEIDKKIEQLMIKYNVKPAFLNYNSFPNVSCVSVNDTLVHGIPSSNIFLKNGDIVSIDIGIVFNNFFVDACRTYFVGDVKENAKHLVKVTEECFFKAVSLIKPNVYLGDVSYVIEKHALDNGFSVPREFAGHGIGRCLHEDPIIPNYGKKNSGIILQEGMCLAIEPMIAEGKKNVKILSDGWTTKMLDGKLSAHYENTLVVTKDGCEILTLNKD